VKSPWGWVMFVLGTGVATFAIATPYRYGSWLDPTATVAIGGIALNFGAGLLLALLHVAKLIFVAALSSTRRSGAWAWLICIAVCLLLAALSIWNAVALLAIQQSARVTEARAAAERADIVRAELKSIGERLALVGWRPLAAVEAEITAGRLHSMWDAASGCTKAANGRQRHFCQGLVRLEGVRGTAAEAERLREREAELRRELAQRPVAMETSQPDLVMLAGWLGLSLVTTEILRTLFWAAVVEVVEIAAFGFVGIFWATSGTHVPATKVERAPALAIAISNADEVSLAAREAPLNSDRGRKADKSGRESTGRRAGKGPHLHAGPRSALRDEGGERRAVDSFIATLSRSPDARVSGSALFGAYDRLRKQHGWPRIAPNVFGQMAGRTVEAVGGHKIKASRQYYVGVALPPASVAKVARVRHGPEVECQLSQFALDSCFAADETRPSGNTAQCPRPGTPHAHGRPAREPGKWAG